MCVCAYIFMKTLNVFTPFGSSPSLRRRRRHRRHLHGSFIIILVVYDAYDSGSFNKQ